MATVDFITDPEIISGLLSVVIPLSAPGSVTQLIRTHRKIDALCRGSLPERVVGSLSDMQFQIGFEIAKTPAQTADEVMAKVDFMLADMDLGEVDGFRDAMRTGIHADMQRLVGAV